MWPLLPSLELRGRREMAAVGWHQSIHFLTCPPFTPAAAVFLLAARSRSLRGFFAVAFLLIAMGGPSFIWWRKNGLRRDGSPQGLQRLTPCNLAIDRTGGKSSRMASRARLVAGTPARV